MVTSLDTKDTGPSAAVKPIPKRELIRALKRRGLSLNKLADCIGTSQTTVKRVVNRDMVSAPCWRKIHAFLRSDGETAA
jgi:lambda repressor-like predicted transcriptional regulator